MGTSKQPRGDRVSTVSLLGCSTSVALAMGPTDEEEETTQLPEADLRIETCRGDFKCFNVKFYIVHLLVHN